MPDKGDKVDKAGLIRVEEGMSDKTDIRRQKWRSHDIPYIRCYIMTRRAEYPKSDIS
jgi:hypothetical protein